MRIALRVNVLLTYKKPKFLHIGVVSTNELAHNLLTVQRNSQHSKGPQKYPPKYLVSNL